MARSRNLPSDHEFSASRKRRVRSLLGRRGTVAVLVAIAAPVLAMAIALGVEISDWTVTKQRVQRAADLAAIGGAAAISNTASAYTGATYAASVAEMNRPTKSASRSPSSGSFAGTLTDTTNTDTITILSPATVGTPGSVKVTIQTSVPLRFAGIALTGPTKTISATATAGPTSSLIGIQTCLLTLGGDTTGVVTGTDVNVSGHVTLDAPHCSIRSDAAVVLSGNLTINAAAIYASGAITSSGNVTVTAPEYANQAQVADPFAGSAAVQNALTAAASCSSTAAIIGASGPNSPGCYGGINLSGSANITLSPGIFYLNGGINLSGSAVLNATGVTFVSTGTINVSGGAQATITAPTTGTTAGIAYASNSTSSSSISGTSAFSFAGLVYYPNGSLSISGTAVDGSTGCAEIVARTITISGNANLASNCSTYGLPAFPSTTPLTTLTQ